MIDAREEYEEDIENNDDIEIAERNNAMENIKKNPAAIGVVVAALLFLLYLIFGGSSKKEAPEDDVALTQNQDILEQISENAEDIAEDDYEDLDFASMQQPPEPPPLIVHMPPVSIPESLPEPEPPAIFEQEILPPIEENDFNMPPPMAFESESFFPPLDEVAGIDNEKIAMIKERKRKSNMVMMSGGREQRLNNSEDNNKKDKDDVESQMNAIDEYDSIHRTSAKQTSPTYAGSGYTRIPQGTHIETVLETAIDTDLEGEISARISKPVYTAEGKIAIPQGARVVGKYDGNIQRGQERIRINWKRIVLSNGIDISIDAPGYDKLGRAGLGGTVDNKLGDVMKNIATEFAIRAAAGIGSAKISKNKKSTHIYNLTDNTSTKTTDTLTDAMQDATKELSDSLKKYFDGQLNTKPTILVQQGTIVKILINHDIIFPRSILRPGGAM